MDVRIVNRLGARSAMAAALALAVAAPAHSMDLLQAYQAALQQDPTVRAARAAADAGREALPQAKAQLYPNIALSAARNYNDLDSTQPNLFGQSTTQHQKYYSDNQAITVRQALYRKHLLDGVAQAAYVVDDANATLERELQNLGVRVAGAYLDALLATDQLALTLAQKDTTNAQLNAAQKALTGGSGTRTDIDEAQAHLDHAVALELESRQQVDFTRSQLEAITNQPVGVLARLDPDAMQLQSPQPPLLDDWRRAAQDQSPEIASLKARMAAAQLAVERARAGHYPSLDAVAQVVRSSNENVTAPRSSNLNHTIGLQLNIPLYAGGYVNSAVRQAMAEQVRAQELHEAMLRDLGLRVYREFRGVSEGVLRVQARKQALRSAEQLVESSKRAQQAGARTSLDVLNAEERKYLARRDLAQARYEYLMARIRLQALAGGDKLDTLTEVNTWLREAQ